MVWLFRSAALGAVGALALGHAALAQQVAAPDAKPAFGCVTGAWRLDDGRVVGLAPTTTNDVRLRTVSGESALIKGTPDAPVVTHGWTDQAFATPLAFGDCEQGLIRFGDQAATRLSLDITETRFQGQQVELAGRLILPPGREPAPIVVLVHGSEDYSAVRHNFMQHLLPASGVGVFVYDKRGTGGSQGRYTQDFHVLAADAVAAAGEARRLAGGRAGRVGFYGASQGGWIAPLAASQTPVDFVAVGFGLAESALAEDRDEVRLGLERKGWGPEVIAEARRITDVTGAFIASRGAVGFDDLDAVRARYRSEPWWADVKGEFTGMLLNATNEQITQMAPALDVGTSWDYEPAPVLRALETPLLWVLAAEDTGAPPRETRAVLTGLVSEGRPITVVQFPDADHGILEFQTNPDGSRTPTRHSEGFIQAVIDWAAHGDLRHSLGRGAVLGR